jgi:hypothetical protein
MGVHIAPSSWVSQPKKLLQRLSAWVWQGTKYHETGISSVVGVEKKRLTATFFEIEQEKTGSCHIVNSV